MKFSAIFTSLFVLAPTAWAAALTSTTTSTLSYDQTYDDASNSLNIVACSDGVNGLESKGYTTFGSLPKFPYIGGAQAVAGWNSASCGTCWELTYSATGKSIYILAIDHAASGFNIALEAMNELTNNQAEFLGRIDVTSQQVATSNCGL